MLKQVTFILTLFFSIPLVIQAQWTVLDIPSAGRYDDISFINDSLGWVAAGTTSRIYKTTDGGTTWGLNLSVAGDYMRSIGFANQRLGFCGSLAGRFYRTFNGGVNWENIAPSIEPAPPGVCGISIPDSMHIYAAGKWKGPAFVLKSSDGGNSFTSIDLSTLAGGFNEILFINRDTGFVCGKSAVHSEGGIILYTTNGGADWQVLHKTMYPGDYVWKIQTPDSIHFYASIEGPPSSGNVRMLRSANRGMSWETRIVSQTHSLSQVVGFVDSLRGWTGGASKLFETNDGGETWIPIAVGVNYNRFRRVNKDLAFLSGDKIYRFNRNITTNTSQHPEEVEEAHALRVFPVPVKEVLNVEIELKSGTDVLLWLIDTQGRITQRLMEDDFKSGNFKFSIPETQLPGHHYFVVLKTNSGIQYKEIVR